MKRSSISKMCERVAEGAGKRTAGVWALPQNDTEVDEIVNLVIALKHGTLDSDENFMDVLANFYGEDELFDSLDDLRSRFMKASHDLIRKSILKMAKRPRSEFKKEREYDALKSLAMRVR